MAQKFKRQSETIPFKANRILNILLGIFGIMILRIWYLTVVEHEDRVEQARRPRERVVLEPAERASITDRFGIPLAQSKVGYQATIIYSEVREIPTSRWERDSAGQRIKKYLRKEHISGLASLLAKELQLDSSRVEDLIHSKASLYSQRPFVLAEGLTEEQYYRLRMLEKEWPGLHARRVPVRDYPFGRVASHIIGYMGAINREEYEAVIGELKGLKQYLAGWEVGEDPQLPEGLANSRQVRERLRELKQRAYRINDSVGKAGVEGRFEENLRGFQGRRTYYSDARGNYLRELPGGQSPLSGQRLTLTLSVELQTFAEHLLVENERVRDGRSSSRDRITGRRAALREPWVKGGAIVAMDPTTGELLALASYPRFDPNDFIYSGTENVKNKRKDIVRWFESDGYLSQIWDGERPESREEVTQNGEKDEHRWIDWDTYLAIVLPDGHPVPQQLEFSSSLLDADRLQGLLEEAYKQVGDSSVEMYDILNVLFSEEGHQTHREKGLWGGLHDFSDRLTSGDQLLLSLRDELLRYFRNVPHNYDKVLLADLYRLAMNPILFDDSTLKEVGEMNLSDYRRLGWEYFTVEKALKDMMRSLFHEVDWAKWRSEKGKSWLRECREREKTQGRYARPYLDLYDRMERELFTQFWEKSRWSLLRAFLSGEEEGSNLELDPYLHFCFLWQRELISGAHSALPWVSSYRMLTQKLSSYNAYTQKVLLGSMRRFNELTRPLWGRYRSLRRNSEGGWSEQQLALAFYPRYGYGAMRSLAYRQQCAQGSIFKLVVAYEAMCQVYRQGGVSQLHLFKMTDKLFRSNKVWNVGRWADGESIPRLYRGGILPRTYRDLGEIGLIEALGYSANPYFAILAGDYIENPEDLLEAARRFSYGSRTGIELPGENRGALPTDLDTNRTGLYSFSMGQHTILNTPLQTSVMLSTLANGGTVYKPQIVRMAAGPDLLFDEEEEVLHRERYRFQECLQGIGIDFPLFTAAEDRYLGRLEEEACAIPLRKVELPEPIRRNLLEGMRLAADHSKEQGGGTLKWVYRDYAKRLRTFLKLPGDLIGKSSTAEQVIALDLDIEKGTNIYNHIWFGGIAFQEGSESSKSFLSRDSIGDPELVVVVHLPFGGYGKEAAPIAAEIIREWREIKARRGE